MHLPNIDSVEETIDEPGDDIRPVNLSAFKTKLYKRQSTTTLTRQMSRDSDEAFAMGE